MTNPKVSSLPVILPSTVFSGRTIPTTLAVTDAISGQTNLVNLGARYPTIREQTVSPNWHPNLASSVVYHPTRRLPPRTAQSGVLIALLIILIAIIVGLFIWAIHLHVTREAKIDEEQRKRLQQEK